MKITKSQLRQIIKEEIQNEMKREYTGIVVANPLTGDLETDDAEIAGEYGPYHVRASSEEEAEEIILISHERGKYGRILGELICDGVNLNDALIADGHAEPYFGGKR